MTTKVKRTTVRKRAGTSSLEKSSGAAPAGPQIAGRLPGQVKYLKGALFGPPKTGKTTAATSGRDTLLIQFDPDGDITETLQGRTDITVMEPQTFKETEEIVRALATTDAGLFPFVTVDSVGFMFQKFGGREINQAYMDNKNIMRPYGKAGAAASQIIHDLVSLPLHVIFTAHLQREDGDDDSVAQETALGEHEVRLAVTPMVWKTLGPAVSFIGRTYKETVYEKEGKTRNKKTIYRVSFNDGERSPAGARITLPGEVEITTSLMQELADKLESEV